VFLAVRCHEDIRPSRNNDLDMRSKGTICHEPTPQPLPTLQAPPPHLQAICMKLSMWLPFECSRATSAYGPFLPFVFIYDVAPQPAKAVIRGLRGVSGCEGRHRRKKLSLIELPLSNFW